MSIQSISISSLYSLNDQQFENLFNKENRDNDKVLYVLRDAAADGNLHSIDMLHNIALRKDDLGDQAEQILFSLFSGEVEGKIGIAQNIQNSSLKLYEVATQVPSITTQKLTVPSKLLYIAGSATLATSEARHDIAKIFTEVNQPQSLEEHVDSNHDGLWNLNRMITTDEISATLKKLDKEKPSENLSFNYPIPIDILEDTVYQKIENSVTPNTGRFLEKPEYFPVNTGEHWVLFGIYKDTADNVEAVVFNSTSALNSDTKTTFKNIAHFAGLPREKDIIYINQDLQKNVPNGCGLFVVKALSVLAEKKDQDPAETLRHFSILFPIKNEEEFNINYRRQIYGDYIDYHLNLESDRRRAHA